MRTNLKTTELVVAAAARQATPFHCRKGGDEFLINFSLSVAMVSPAPGLRLRPLQEVSLAKYIEIPMPLVAVNNGLSRYITINNAYSRNLGNSSPVAQYNETSPASSFILWALFPQVECPPALTQVNPGLAQSHLTFGAKILTQSDRFQPNLSQRVFRQTFRPNLTYGQMRVGSCPFVIDVSAPILLPNVPASSRSKQALTRSDKAKQASKKCADKACYKFLLSTLRSQISDQ